MPELRQIIHATMAPAQCPVCKHGQDYFIRLPMAPLCGVIKRKLLTLGFMHYVK